MCIFAYHKWILWAMIPYLLLCTNGERENRERAGHKIPVCAVCAAPLRAVTCIYRPLSTSTVLYRGPARLQLYSIRFFDPQCHRLSIHLTYPSLSIPGTEFGGHCMCSYHNKVQKLQQVFRLPVEAFSPEVEKPLPKFFFGLKEYGACNTFFLS